jgi:hypothetical protein
VDSGELAALVPPGRRAVVYLGVLSAYQGVDHLLAAIPQVVARVPEAYFLVMGYPNEDRYREKAAELGVAERVAFPGRIDYRQAARYLAGWWRRSKLSETESNGKLYNYMVSPAYCGVDPHPVGRSGRPGACPRAIRWAGDRSAGCWRMEGSRQLGGCLAGGRVFFVDKEAGADGA